MADYLNRRTFNYKAASSVEPYKAIMNSLEIQIECLKAARRIERIAAPQLDPGSTVSDVGPGKIRAHARVKAERRIERKAWSYWLVSSWQRDWRNINYNKKIDRVLNEALNRCAIN